MKKKRLFFLCGEKIRKLVFSYFLISLITFHLLPGFVYANAQTKISLSIEKESLVNVFKTIQSQSEYRFLYSNEDIRNLQIEQLNIESMSIEDILKDVLKSTNLTWEIEESIIYIRKMRNDVQQNQVKSITISGIVMDKQGDLIPGVSVMIKGTSLGTATDTGGKFKMDVPQSDRIVLTFTFVGMKSQEVTYRNESELKVYLEEDVTEMDDVIITGIYTRKKESFTGSSATYTAKELKMIGNQNVLQSLRTLDPSFAIIESNEWGSDPNRLPDIEIRGKTSIIGLTDEFDTDPNQPLFILDGFESDLKTISDLSIDRVESITILKDAASTAIYGSKAANGVVVVETKMPIAGKLRVRYDLGMKFEFADLSDYNLMNSQEKVIFERLSGAYWGLLDDDGNLLDETQADQYYDFLKEVKRGVDTYWLNEPLRFAFSNNHNVYVDGGDEAMRYGVGLSYNNVRGVMKNSNRNVLNGNIRLVYRYNNFSFSNLLDINYTKAEREPVAFTEFAEANPYYKKYDDNGLPYMRFKTANNVVLYNPLYDMKNVNSNETDVFGITNKFQLDWKALDELILRVRFGLSKDAENSQKFRSPFNTEFSGKSELEKGTYTESNVKQFGYTGELNANYSYLLNEVHLLNAVAGVNFDHNESRASGFQVTGFTDEEFKNPSYALGYTKDSKPSFSDSKKRSSSFYVNLNYAYDNRYLVDANYRSDGSSIFGIDNHFTNTWSVGLAWNIHNEPFSRNVNFLNLLKIRASMGNPGNQSFADYISMRIYRYTQANTNIFGSGIVIDKFANKELDWQKTLDFNVGFDLMLLNNRFRFNFDYFNKRTDPLLVYIGTPSSTGTDKISRNLGEQVTKGLTLSLQYNFFKSESINWSVNGNLRHFKERYEKMGDALEKFNLENQSQSLTRYYDGGSPNDLWAVRSAGIDPRTGLEVFIDKEGRETFVHSYDDEVKVGNSEPKVEGVFGTSFYYKGFSVSMNFRYRVGGQIFMTTLYEKVENINDKFKNQDKRALYSRWQKEGDDAKFRSIRADATPISSRFVKDNNILAGESISIGYETQHKWLNTFGASSLTLRAYMNDIFHASSVKNERGIQYPFARSVSFSLGIQF